MPFDSRDVPQADSLQDVIATVEAVANGSTTFQSIAQNIGKGGRQGRYYRLAAEQLGLIVNANANSAAVTPLGRQFVEFSPEQRRVVLADAVLHNEPIMVIFETIVNNPGITRAQIVNILVDNQLNHRTAKRRCSTILSWLQTLDLIRLSGAGYIAIWRPAFEGQAIQDINVDTVIPMERALLLRELDEVWGTDFEVAENGTITYELNPALRQMAMHSHQILVRQMVMIIRRRGAIPRYNQNIDLSAELPEGHYLFEMKTCNDTNWLHQTRRGISQLYEYRYRYSNSLPNPNLWLVFGSPIRDGWYIDYLTNDRGINICWRNEDAFEAPDQCRESLGMLENGH